MITLADDRRYSIFGLGKWARRKPVDVEAVRPAPLPNAELERAAQATAAAIKAKSVEMSRMSMELRDLAEEFLDKFEGKKP